MRTLAGAFVLLALAGGPAAAVQPDEILPDPRLEARARVLSMQLRCMVCQNQSIDDSDAPLARDLRLLVRERLRAGDSDREVLDFLVARYGEFVLLKPRFSEHTALLWALPFAAFGLGSAALVLSARRRRAAEPEAPALTSEERRALDAMLSEGSEDRDLKKN